MNVTTKLVASLPLTAALLLGPAAPLARAIEPESAVRSGAFDPSSFTVFWMARSQVVASALHALDAQELGRAIELSEAALLLPLTRIDRLAALNVLCIAHVDRGTASLGLPHCSRLVRESQGDWRALNNRANARLGVGDVERAIADYELALGALRELPEPPPVRHPISGRMASAHDTLAGNLDIARRRFSQTLRYVHAPDAPRD